MRLKNKVAIVTGASSGIGLEIAKMYAKEGAKVVLSDINEENGKEALQEIGEQARFFKCDVSSNEEVQKLLDFTVETFGSLDVMVNNAGVGTLGTIYDTPDDVWDKTIGINLNGVFYGCRAAAKYMKENNIKGSIINTSSILGTVGLNGAVSYCASKGGVVQITHAGAVDLAPFGIRMNAIAPGFIETNMTKGVLESEEFSSMVKGNTPMGHVGKPSDIAYAALYLASDESVYVTGEVIHVDGGWRAH